MNIYLDIDDIILGTKSPKRDIEELLLYILEHYPDTNYWLTTHCKGGVNRRAEWLRQNYISSDLVDELDKSVKSTDWEVMKTEAIDLDQDFVWFDDTLFETERNTLETHYVLDGFYRMDPKDPEAAKKALEYLKSLASVFPEYLLCRLLMPEQFAPTRFYVTRHLKPIF